MDYKEELVLLEGRIHKMLNAVEMLAKDVSHISAAISVIGGGEGYSKHKFIPGFDSVDKMVKEIHSDMTLIKEDLGGEKRIIIK